MGQAKCFSCLSPKLQYQLRTYLLAKIALGDTSITGVQALSVASTCFSCLTHGELLAAKQYLMAVWLGLDTTKTGIIAQAATAACDYACLTPVQAEQVRTYLLAVTAGVATDAAGVRALELAAKCFECPTNKRQLEMQVYLLSTLAPGAPTTASAIMQAAGCFLACVPPELHEAFQTSLLAQVAGRSTPPCVTPTAPSQPTVVTATTNLIKIAWTQPSNSGSLITSYTISWGTATGVYTNSATVGGGIRNYTISGLSQGTAYFFVVTANAFTGCSSANSPEQTATTGGIAAPCAAGTTFANAWAARVVANGGAAPSASTITAIANFQCGLIADGLDTLMVTWNAMVPDSIVAAMTPQFIGPVGGSGTDPWTNNNFVLADLTVNGLKGDGVTKSITTGIALNNVIIDNSQGFTAYCYQNVAEGTTDAGDRQQASFGNSWFGFWLNVGNSGNAECQMDNNVTNQVIWTPPSLWQGFISVNKTSATRMDMYAANSVTPFANVASTNGAVGGVPPAVNLVLYGYKEVNGVPTNLSSKRFSFWAVHFGLTSAQLQNFFNRIQALRVALGGGFR